VLGDRFAHGASKEEALERARALLARFGLEGREAERPEDLSGGQQQRVAIARAFAGRPRAMLLDEVTSALDPELVGEVLEAVRDLKHEGVTVLIATHEMSFAREVADLVGFLHDGRIIELGPPDQVLTDPERPETNAVPAAPARGGEDLVRLCQPGASCSAPASAFSRSG
jgi:polar amino acid transport system ATP-binding protein